MIEQVEIALQPKSRGFHLVTNEIMHYQQTFESGYLAGVYFCEYRNYGGARELVVTITGE